MEQKEKLPQLNSLEELIKSGFGCFENIFFSNKDDWSKIILMFNGAITKQKISINEDAAIYQRWSWHSKFKHPVFCIADPLTYGDGAIPLAWYQGNEKGDYLEKIVNQIKNAISTFNPGKREFIAFGSSGGGFAALLSAQLALVDAVIAINPQTNIYNFAEKRAVEAFLKKRESLNLKESDGSYCLIKKGFDSLKPDCRITYIQNTCDASHFNDHMIPYINALLCSGKSNTLNLHCFTNIDMGHNPPPLHAILNILDNDLTSITF